MRCGEGGGYVPLVLDHRVLGLLMSSLGVGGTSNVSPPNDTTTTTTIIISTRVQMTNNRLPSPTKLETRNLGKLTRKGKLEAKDCTSGEDMNLTVRDISFDWIPFINHHPTNQPINKSNVPQKNITQSNQIVSIGRGCGKGGEGRSAPRVTQLKL